MAASKVPFSTLLSFGAMVFTGAGIPANVTTDSTTLDISPAVTRPRMPNPAIDYALPRLGYAQGDIPPYVSAWTLTVQAGDGLTTAQKTQALEGAYATWYALWLGTHTHRGQAGTTGQLGDLEVLDATGTAYRVEAELRTLPLMLVAGENVDIMTLLLEFFITEDWTIGGAPAVYGEAVYGASAYA